MSKTEIISALAKMSAADRHDVLDKILELEEDDWLDAGDLTAEERSLIESRLAAHRKNPDAAIPWEDLEARLLKRFAA